MSHSKRKREESKAPEGKAAKASKTAPKQDASTESKAPKPLSSADLNRKYLSRALDSIWSADCDEKPGMFQERTCKGCQTEGLCRDNGLTVFCRACTLATSSHACFICGTDDHFILECQRLHATAADLEKKQCDLNDRLAWPCPPLSSELFEGNCTVCLKTDQPDCLRLIRAATNAKRTICATCIMNSNFKAVDEKDAACSACRSGKSAKWAVRGHVLCADCFLLAEKANGFSHRMGTLERRYMPLKPHNKPGRVDQCGQCSVPDCTAFRDDLAQIPQAYWCVACITKESANKQNGLNVMQGDVCNFCATICERGTACRLSASCSVCPDCRDTAVIIANFQALCDGDPSKEERLPVSFEYYCTFCLQGYHKPSLCWFNRDDEAGSACCDCIIQLGQQKYRDEIVEGTTCFVCNAEQQRGKKTGPLFTIANDLTGAEVNICGACYEFAIASNDKESSDDEDSANEEDPVDESKAVVVAAAPPAPQGAGKGPMSVLRKWRSSGKKAESASDNDAEEEEEEGSDGDAEMEKEGSASDNDGDVPVPPKQSQLKPVPVTTVKADKEEEEVIVIPDSDNDEEETAAPPPASASASSSGGKEETKKKKPAVAAAAATNDKKEKKAPPPSSASASSSGGKEEKQKKPAARDPSKVCTRCEKWPLMASNDRWDDAGKKTICSIHRECVERDRLRSVGLADLEEAVKKKFGKEGYTLVREMMLARVAAQKDLFSRLQLKEKPLADE